MSHFVSYWSRGIWREKEGSRDRLSLSWVPASAPAANHIDAGDVVYMVGIKEGELLPISAMRVEAVYFPGRVRPDGLKGYHEEAVVLVPRDSERFNTTNTLPPRDADALTLLTPVGGDVRYLKRKNGTGGILSQNFMGANCVRELVSGSKALDDFFKLT